MLPKALVLFQSVEDKFTNLGENESLIFKRRKASSAGDALLLQLLAGLWPGIRVFITLLLEVNTSILQEQPINWLVQPSHYMGVDVCDIYSLNNFSAAKLANGKVVVND